MKLVIQIPCFNEAETLPATLAGIPTTIDGISSISILIIDDGSTDGTAEVAKKHGVTNIVRNTSNLGLAQSFRRGIDSCLQLGADVIVNMDGDNQYKGSDIPELIKPILLKKADVVVGDRDTDSISEFSTLKKFLQRFGSFVLRRLSSTPVRDATSGFRAFSRDAAIKLTILSNYTHTHEAILQARSKNLVFENVCVTVNPKTRQSRLMTGIRSYLVTSAVSILRVFTMYHPLKIFLSVGLIFMLCGAGLVGRFIYFYLTAGGAGKIQSLIIAAILLIGGISIILVGVLADVIQFNRRLLEDILERLKRLELKK